MTRLRPPSDLPAQLSCLIEGQTITIPGGVRVERLKVVWRIRGDSGTHFADTPEKARAQVAKMLRRGR